MEETKAQVRAENKMGTMPCNKLLVTMAVPMMLSMIVQALYNIVDSIYVSRVCEDALTAVSLAFPVQTFTMAIISGIGVGANARLSKKLGEKHFEEVNQTAGAALVLIFICTILFTVCGLFIPRLYYTMMTPDAEIVQYGVDYLQIIMLVSIAFNFQMTFERLLQSTGRTIYSMISQTTGAVLNIILDPIMIFGMFGLPAMGTAGAAVATVTGQAVAACLGLIFNLKCNHDIHYAVKYLRLKGIIVKEIFMIGVPSMIMMAIGSFMNLGMNKILLGFSSTASAVFGVYFKLQSFIFMPVFGLNGGVVPIVAYNYGARRPDRIKETYKLSVIYATCIMIIGIALFELFPDQMLSMFNASDNMLEIGRVALRVIAVHFIFAGFGIMSGSVFQALGHGILSLWVSMIRQLFVILPSAFILSKVIGLNGVWFSFPIAEIFGLTFSAIFIRHIMKTQVDPLALPEA